MKRVAVLRGGPSEEYDVSMRSGSAVLNALRELDYNSRDIVITKSGDWLECGFVRSPESALEAVDVVFIALHGAYGEDGQVQKILHRKNIPFTGSGSLPSAIAFNKDLTKQTLKAHNIKMPRHRRFSRQELDRLDEELPNIFSEIGSEVFVKPLASGSSHGARHIPNPETLRITLPELLELYDEVMIEEFIRGKEATVGVLSDYRDHKLYSLPVVEIMPPQSDSFYSYENKYDGSTQQVCPGRFSYEEKATLAAYAETAHQALGLSQYSRSDFLIRNGEVYFLEVNTLPGFTEQSNFPKAAAAVGLDFKQLVQHLIETATV